MISGLIFDHIGYATPSIEKTAQYYLNAGYVMSDIVYDPVQNVNISFLSKSEMPLIELLEPVDSYSPIVKTIEKSGVTPYHVCYRVFDIEDSIKQLKVLKFIPLSKPVKAIAFDNRMICFLFNKDVGLIELLEEDVSK